ncbi:MAG: type II toxin-antitoxin system VapB family antitoxin [Sulfuritalea sp.]|jgi:plasmid stability protein|nr:type II toxin-antitoxin system VapB family antitoxin [Sulfuritalea sp.]
MPTLVLRNVPTELHGKLKAAAAAHHRSMTQEAIVALSAAMGASAPQAKPSTEATLAWLDAMVWPRLTDDNRTPDQIVGYDVHGLPG